MNLPISVVGKAVLFANSSSMLWHLSGCFTGYCKYLTYFGFNERSKTNDLYFSFLICYLFLKILGWLWYEGELCNSCCWIFWPLQGGHHYLLHFVHHNYIGWIRFFFWTLGLDLLLEFSVELSSHILNL